MIKFIVQSLFWVAFQLNIVPHLTAENVALCQQPIVLKRNQPRPKLSNRDRLFWVTLSRLWAGWRDAPIIVKPETVVRWHRQGFKGLLAT
jgi:hypothetical protein